MTRAARLSAVLLAAFLIARGVALAQSPESAGPTFQGRIATTIERHLGRRYVWGASGLKSFDCSGFVWRVLSENGMLLKRSTARKYYMMLKPTPRTDRWTFGTLVFFDDLKHVGIVDSAETFYHAHVTGGTSRLEMNEFWRRQLYGFRRLPPAPPAP